MRGKDALERMPSPSEVTDEAWARLARLIPAARPGGRPQEMARREILHAMVSVLRGGGPWRLLPHDLPRWFTASGSFRRGKPQGMWEEVHAALRRAWRVSVGREAEPSAAILDRPSRKTRAVRGDERGYDAGKSAVRFAEISVTR